MHYDLIDYQRAAAADCLSRLDRARSDWNERGNRSGFALSAVTGAGKTVIASAVIEAMLHGSADLGVDSDSRASFLWVTDDPALNRQTRSKMLASSDLLQPARLIELDNGFLDSTLSPGRVYFLNVQKLSANAGLSQGGINLRQFSMWDIIRHTITGGEVDLYLVLDEAHRGMKAVADRRSIVQRIIHGQKGSNPPAPVVWGISATIRRFVAAMDGATEHTMYPPVEVDINGVRKSGLIKDEIILDEPAESATMSSTLLREAVQSTIDYEKRWAKYSESQDEPRVLPVLVVQVPDKVTPAALSTTVATIEAEWPGLGPDAVAHVFGEHDRLNLHTRAVEWVPPESIQDDAVIRVVLAKQAISTGWDCPRAEVLYSERPATDVTHIAQIIGRMVRQPLAHRIATDDTLNTVSCFLPHFNRDALGSIKDELEGAGQANGDSRVGATIARGAVAFERNRGIASEVFDVFTGLPSMTTPDKHAEPLRRAKELARLLSDTAGGSALLPDANRQLTRKLMKKLDGLAAEFEDEVDAEVANLETIEVRRGRLSTLGIELGSSTRSVRAHDTDLARDTGRIIGRVREGVGKDYLAHRVERRDDDSEDLLDVRTKVAALFSLSQTMPALELEATQWVRERLTQFKVAIANTTGATRDSFRRIQEQTNEAEVVGIDLRDNYVSATRSSSGSLLPAFVGHLYATDAGEFTSDLNDWESEIVRTELARPNFEGWFRNPSRATSASLRIAYRDDAGNWRSVQPDFIFVSRRDDGEFGVSIVDPHGSHLADARAKLLALATYAEQYGESFVRIDSIAKANGELRVIDLLDAQVRAGVRSFEGADVGALYVSEVARAYA